MQPSAYPIRGTPSGFWTLVTMGPRACFCAGPSADLSLTSTWGTSTNLWATVTMGAWQCFCASTRVWWSAYSI